MTDLDLFSWPQSAPARTEQMVLPVEGTIQAKWEAWRDGSGRDALEAMGTRAAMQAAAGMGVRLSAKALVEFHRATCHEKINNVFTAHIARWIEDNYPVTRGKFEKRERKAA